MINSAEFQNWLSFCKSLKASYMAKYFPNNPTDELTAKNGRKYIKINCGSSVWSFVNKENGDILRPASWKAPAKQARGNIYDEYNGMKYINNYGPAYMRC